MLADRFFRVAGLEDPPARMSDSTRHFAPSSAADDTVGYQPSGP